MTAFDALLAKMQEAANQPHYGHIIAGEAGMLLEMGDRQYGAVLSAAKDATRWLDLPQFREATETCDFFLSDFQTKRISVFVCLPLPDLKHRGQRLHAHVPDDVHGPDVPRSASAQSWHGAVPGR